MSIFKKGKTEVFIELNSSQGTKEKKKLSGKKILVPPGREGVKTPRVRGESP